MRKYNSTINNGFSVQLQLVWHEFVRKFLNCVLRLFSFLWSTPCCMVISESQSVLYWEVKRTQHKADSQEDAPFSIAPFMSCCDTGVISAKSSSRMFLHFSFFSSRILFFVCLVNCWPEVNCWSEGSYSVLVVSRGSVRPSPPCLSGRASMCLSASLTPRPTRAGITWSLMAFWSGSNNSVVKCKSDHSYYSHHAPLIASQRLQAHKENALTERARWKQRGCLVTSTVL